ncbi:SGNH/GDSL hydrolase family protein [Arcobacter arenosus]|uniref:SGNH/GDSL hydrolase family protein n=1 Tax=Arcobacter arenosus TaxID=2576037 RepID=A0A5R8Y0H1_9BACT|nr:SGNH/GDSL hydrolase family protein [Arcobacter arenosus]TLP37798.1 SGNH/GDSL hydrolase family protein [Arcobacter arenosus]
MSKKILALGDCNTEGDVHFRNNAFPERFAKQIDFECINCGYTMSTTKEMINFYNDNISEEIDVILIQYGLVDSWRTFKYSPYVLYYPDSFFRKLGRKIIKKYKKIARSLGLNTLFGSKFSVSPEEYKRNIEKIVNDSKDKLVFLIDTIPNKDLKRNIYIKQYNSILDEISTNNKNCHKVNLYDEFEKNLDNFYLDETHINDKGYDLIAKRLNEKYQEC